MATSLKGIAMNELAARWNSALIQEYQRRFGGKPAGEVASALEQATFTNAPKQPNVIVLLGSAGAGKTSVGQGLEQYGVQRLVRVITRQPKEHEVPGKDYIFLTHQEFENRETKHEFVSVVKKTQEWRALPKSQMLRFAREKIPFYIDSKRINLSDFKDDPELKNLRYITVFILPPDFTTMITRLKNRAIKEQKKGDTAAKLGGLTRVADWVNESLEQLQEYASKADVFLVNDRLDHAIAQLSQLVS